MPSDTDLAYSARRSRIGLTHRQAHKSIWLYDRTANVTFCG
jgi:hypothetical protein